MTVLTTENWKNIEKHEPITGIMYREWNVSDPKAILLLVHGMGAHTGRWESLASFFAENGMASYALELRGFGEAGGKKGDIDSFRTYFDDIRHLADIIRKENPEKNIFLLGESLGAIIAFIFASRSGKKFKGLICISPVFKSRLKFKIKDYWRMTLALLFKGNRPFKMPFTGAMCTRDEKYRRILVKDKREHRVATPRMLLIIGISQLKSWFLARKIKMSVLFLLSGKDSLGDPATSEKIFNNIPAKDKDIKHYPEMYHALSIEAGREEVFGDILKWIKRRV